MGRKVFLIEDNPLERQQLASFFRENDFEVRAVENSMEGLQEIPSFRPDLVIVDYIIPGSDGLDTIQKIRLLKGFEKIPVILLSGFEKDILEMEHLQYPNVKFLPKPYDFLILLKILKNLLN